MYKAIIADDENKICQLIQVMGNWEELGIEIVDVCHSGDDAWDSIQEKEPDIILTDIRMPVYDGLQIINKVNEKYGMSRNICFIIISGYAEFEYARQAIQYNIVNYLLKPLDKNQLNDALQKACNSLNMKQQQAENEIKLQENRRFLQAGCVTALQEMGIHDVSSVDDLNRQFCTSFETGVYQGMFLNFPFSISESENLFLKTFMEKLKTHFGFCHEVVLKSEGTGIYLVLNYRQEDQAILPQVIQGFYKSICEIAKTYGEFQLYLGIGRPVGEIGEMRRSLKEAETAELSRLIYEGKMLISYESLPGETIGLYQLIPMKKFKDLEPVLEKLNSFEVKKWFSDITSLVEKNRGALKNAEVLMDLKKVVAGIVREVLSELEDSLVEKSLQDLNVSLKQASNLSNYLWILKTKVVLLVDQITEIVSQRESHPISAAKQYIQQNFSQPVTLTEVAERLNFSSVYFGNMFKKHTGKSFNAYLTDVRMENAKKLLKKSENTIAEIANMVGYQDVKYFSKTFKSIYGVKPTEYKKMLASLHAHNLNI